MTIYEKLTVSSALLLMTVFPVWSLSFEDVLERVYHVAEVQNAALEVKAAEKQYALSSFPGDSNLTFSPSITGIGEEDDSSGVKQADIKASLNAGIPVGLSKERQLALSEAGEALERARMNLQQARVQAYADIFTLYKKAWLAQQEVEVVELELEAARENARVTRELFERGDAALMDLNGAEDDLNIAESGLVSAQLAERIGRLELNYAVGLGPSSKDTLEPVNLEFREIPRPPELTDWAVEHSLEVREKRDEIAALYREMDASYGVISPPTLRLSFSGWDQDASLSYSAENPSFGFSYSFPLAGFGEDLSVSEGGSSDRDTWQIGLSVSLPIRSGETDRREAELNRTRISSSEAQIELLEDSLALRIRSLYQQYVLSSETVEQTRRAVETAEKTLDTVLSRRSEQRATSADEFAALAQLERARFRHDSAITGQQEAKLMTASAACWLENLWEKHSVFTDGER